MEQTVYEMTKNLGGMIGEDDKEQLIRGETG